MSYQPIYTITPMLLSRVEQIAALRERILAATVQVEWIPALQKDTRVRNTHSSTAIEGNPLTLEQVRAVEEGREVPAVTASPFYLGNCLPARRNTDLRINSGLRFRLPKFAHASIQTSIFFKSPSAQNATARC